MTYLYQKKKKHAKNTLFDTLKLHHCSFQNDLVLLLINRNSSLIVVTDEFIVTCDNVLVELEAVIQFHFINIEF